MVQVKSKGPNINTYLETVINVFGATFSNTETSEVNFIKNCKLERKETDHFIKNQLVNKRCDERNVPLIIVLYIQMEKYERLK